MSTTHAWGAQLRVTPVTHHGNGGTSVLVSGDRVRLSGLTPGLQLWVWVSGRAVGLGCMLGDQDGGVGRLGHAAAVENPGKE
jgi:hypothetical protein